MAFSNNGRIRVNITGARGAIGLDIQGTPQPGQFVAFGANSREAFPSNGTGADSGLRTDLAAPTGAALLGFAQGGTGAVSKPVRDELRANAVTPDQFKLASDTTDDASFEKAKAYAIANRRGIRLLARQYVFNQTHQITIPSGSGGKFCIFGESSATTSILFTGDKNANCLTITGNMPEFDHLRISGIKIHRPDGGASGLGSGIGLEVRNVRNFIISDMDYKRNGVALSLVGCLVGTVQSMRSYYDGVGISMEQGPFLSTPNAINLIDCSLLASVNNALRLDKPTLVTMIGGTIEDANLENANPATSNAIVISNAAQAGGVAFTAMRVYFENNRGRELYINHVDSEAAYYIIGCTSNRFGSSPAPRIIVDASGVGLAGKPLQLDLSGSTFIGYPAGSTPYSPSADVPVVSVANPNVWPGFKLIDDTALYQHPQERQNAPLVSRHPFPGQVAVFSVNGSIEPMPYPIGLRGGSGGASPGLVKIGTGHYKIYPVGGSVEKLFPMVTLYPGGEARTYNVVPDGGNSFDVRTFRADGITAEDAVFYFMAFGTLL